MAIGPKRHLVTLQTRAHSVDSFGDDTRTYTDLGTAWAEIIAVSALERLESQQIEAEVTHKISIRWVAAYEALAPDDRVTYGVRTFEVVSNVDEKGDRHELTITARERK